jgi:hypothetical protein
MGQARRAFLATFPSDSPRRPSLLMYSIDGKKKKKRGGGVGPDK